MISLDVQDRVLFLVILDGRQKIWKFGFRTARKSAEYLEKILGRQKILKFGFRMARKSAEYLEKILDSIRDF